MIRHYLKIAFRNMWKYKGQTLISVAGLAVGFACFAMATLWIRYEMMYDSFHKNADRMYCVNKPYVFSPNGMTRMTSRPMSGYLQATFPEITKAVTILPERSSFEIEGVTHEMDLLQTDSSFFGMFDVRLVEGSMDFMIPRSKKIAITREKALQLFGNESPLGKTVKSQYEGDFTVCAVITGLPKRSNYPFDFLSAHRNASNWKYSGGEHTLVEIAPYIDIETFKQKLYAHKIIEMDDDISKITLTPLTSVRYEDPNINRDVKFEHILLFAIAGSLLILCTLFNYLTLFVSRFRIRRKEFTLRMVYGASGRSLFALLSVEFVLSLVVALVVGLMLIDLVNPYFVSISEVKLELSAIFLETVIYIAAIIVIALSVFVLMLALFRRRTLNANIRSNRKMFRKISIAVQLTVSIVFAFCTIVILKQMYYLHNTDLGFSFKNRGSMHIYTEYENIKVLNDKIKQIPEIEETITGYYPLLPIKSNTNFMINTWDDMQKNAEKLSIQYACISEEYAKFYEFELLEGEFFTGKDDPNSVIINESAAKKLGWNKAAGKSFTGQLFEESTYTVKGVVKNVYNFSPTVAAKQFFYGPAIKYQFTPHKFNEQPEILIRYRENRWKTCVDKISKIVAEDFPDLVPEFSNAEDEYDKYLKSENALLAILTVVSFVCMTVCVFGFISTVSLTCEERRREIAIRKINGATIKDILDIFFKEHLTLLVIGSLIAFPAGYIVMKRWLEQYVIQTEIGAWIYLSILLALIMAIVMCVGGRVYKTSHENPIKAINN